MSDPTYTREHIARMIQCAPLLPAPGDMEVAALARSYLTLMDERDDAQAGQGRLIHAITGGQPADADRLHAICRAEVLRAAEVERDNARESAANFDRLIGRCWSVLGPQGGAKLGIVPAIEKVIRELDALRVQNTALRTALTEALALMGEQSHSIGGHLRAAWVPVQTARRWRLALGETSTTTPTEEG